MRIVEIKTTKKIFQNVFGAFLIFFVSISLISSAFSSSSEDDFNLVISEIMYNPESGGDDWIEIINNGEKEIELKSIGKNKIDLRIHLGKNSWPVYFSEESLKIKKNEVLVISKNPEKFLEKYYNFEGEIIKVNFSLTGKKDNLLKICRAEGEDPKCFDEVRYSSDWGGNGNDKTLEKIDLKGDNSRKNWTESVCMDCVCATPGKKYEKIDLNPSNFLKIWEVLPKPGDFEGGEFIELKNVGKEEISLENWRIEDESGNDFDFDCKGRVPPNDFFVIKKDESRISLDDEEKLFLFYSRESNPIDSVDYKKAIEGVSFGRKKDKLEKTFKPTPGEENIFPEEIEYPKAFYINEIMPDPIGSDSGNEWFEIYYFGESQYLMSGWKIRDASGKEKELDDSVFDSNNRYLVFNSKVSLNNSGGDELFLLNPKNEIVDKVKYPSAEEGMSWSRKKDGKYIWTNILTPGEKNKFPVKKKYPRKIKFNEILSNPDGIDKNNEWVEFFNENDFEVDLSGWKIENSRQQKFEIEKAKIGTKKLAVISIKETSFSIKNSNEKLILLDPNEEKVDEVGMPESASSGASYNLDKKGDWSWSRFPTPGHENKINNLPQIKIKIPDNFYQGMKMEFDASKTKDLDGDKLKFRWEFGDGRKSYLEKTNHVYEKTGDYKVVLRVGDGSGYVFKEFEIEVEKYPEKKIKIVKLIPNPVGKDSENEIIWLKNETSKEVNLKSWSVATGSSSEKLVNHPIYDDFIIEPGKIKELTRQECKFNLLNKVGRVVLRYPNGETADKVKYEKDKIEEGEILEIRDGELFWLEFFDTKQAIGYQEVSNDIQGRKDVSVQGISFEKQLLKAILNDEMKCCETLSKIIIDNWKHQNQNWLELGGPFFAQT